jgi:hypothetical protein
MLFSVDLKKKDWLPKKSSGKFCTNFFTWKNRTRSVPVPENFATELVKPDLVLEICNKILVTRRPSLSRAL